MQDELDRRLKPLRHEAGDHLDRGLHPRKIADTACRIYRAAAYDFPTGGWANVPLDTTDFDLVPGGFQEQADLTNNRIVIRVPGVYLISAHAGFTPTWVGLKGVRFNVDGAGKYPHHAGDDTYVFNRPTSGLWRCEAGDLITLGAYNASGAVRALDVSNSSYNSLSVFLMQADG